jgi:hypothetical protein
VLHIFYRDDLPSPSLGDLLTRPNGWYGIEGSSSNEFVRRLATLADVEAIANAPQAGGPDNQPVIVLLEALNSGFVRFLQNRKWYSFGRPDALGHGTMAEGISARIPQIRPYVVPAFTYGAATPEPILTLAVDTHIVMRSDLAEDTVYRFTQTLVENKARFGPTHPGLFRGIREDFDRSTLAFPLHSGARRYLDRDQPTMFERYAEVANVSVYLLIIIATAIAASIRWHSRRRKVRVDAYYGKVLTIRRRALAQPGEDHGEAINAVQSIYDEALEKLKDEQLAPNESFHILMTLCSDTIRELRGHASPG